MDFTKHIEPLSLAAGVPVVSGELLRNHTSFGIGGPAALFATVRTAEQAGALLRVAAHLKIPVLVLGGGTNLLVSDDGYNGLAIRTLFSELHIAEDCETVTVGASIASSALVETLVSKGLAGLEFAAGLPGSVGGAVAGNAGCFGATFGERLLSATVVTSGGAIESINSPQWFHFDYRSSRIHNANAIIVDVTLQIQPEDPVALRQISNAHIETRQTKHPPREMKTAGSYFKNLPPAAPGEWRQAAGALLDQVDAKNTAVGDAAVFEKHANILINRGHATARDVLALEAILKKRVFEKFGVTLEPEVRFEGIRPECGRAGRPSE